MALDYYATELDASTKGLLLLTMKASNEFKPEHQPFIEEVLVKKDGGWRGIQFKTDPPNQKLSGQFNEYLVSLLLPPGDYTLMSAGDTSIRYDENGNYGFFQIPIRKRFEVRAGTIIYGGYIDAVNRKRVNDDEERAGIIFPVANQLASDYFLGTFDVTITDRYDEDVARYRAFFPALRGRQIERGVLGGGGP